MDAPPPGRPGPEDGRAVPPDGGAGMSGAMKAVIAILVAAVIGLGVALAVVAADDGDEDDRHPADDHRAGADDRGDDRDRTDDDDAGDHHGADDDRRVDDDGDRADDDDDNDRPRDDHRGKRRHLAVPSSPRPGTPGGRPRARLCALVSEAPRARIAGYQADPERIGRVLLLYSGGLDTSVMLHWIQRRYGVEIVTLTVDLGQPGEDWKAVLGSSATSAPPTRSASTRARSSPATTCCRRSARRPTAAATRCSRRWPGR